MALMELFYKYCENNEEDVEIEAEGRLDNEYKKDEAKSVSEIQQKWDIQKLEEASFPLRQSEQQNNFSSTYQEPQSQQNNLINDWGKYVKQAEAIKGCQGLKSHYSPARQAAYPNSRGRPVQIKGKVTPAIRSLCGFRKYSPTP